MTINVNGFILFCYGKPADEEYDYFDNKNCALAQFLGYPVTGTHTSQNEVIPEPLATLLHQTRNFHDLANLLVVSMFKDFVSSKPADEEYDYEDLSNCAFAQFLRETGLSTDPIVFVFTWDGRYPIPPVLTNVLRAHDTFGALARAI